MPVLSNRGLRFRIPIQIGPSELKRSRYTRRKDAVKLANGGSLRLVMFPPTGPAFVKVALAGLLRVTGRPIAPETTTDR
jgi:hypothetical protein